MQVVSFLKHTWKRPGLWIALVSILVAVTAANRAEPRNYQWPRIQDRGGTYAMSSPAFVLTTQDQALIWRPSGTDTPLTYLPLAGRGAAVPIVPYSDVEPLRWEAVPASLSTFHLIWRERDGRLRSALIDTGGQTIRGPIELAADAQPDFVTVPLPDGGSLVLWIAASRGQLALSRIDPDGRPGSTSRPLPAQIERIAAALDQEDVVHLAWLASSSPGTWTIYYQATSAADSRIDAPESLYTFALTPEESVASFVIGLDGTHGYIIWSTAAAAQPDLEHVHTLTFPLGRAASGALHELQLPQHFSPSENVRAADLAIGRVGEMPSAPHLSAALRWPRPAPGQHDILPVAVALYTPDGWRPGVVYYRDGAGLGFQIVGQFPADAGPPTLSADPSGTLHLAWSGLQGSLFHLYTADTGQQGLAAAPPSTDGAAYEVLAGILAGISLGLFWVVFPTCLVLLSPDNTWTLPLAFALYGLAKLVWPPALFAQPSPALAAAGLGRLDPGLAVALGTLVIAVISVAVFRAAYYVKRPLWQRWLVYALLDAALTWGVFGANVFHW
ncbi:MAG TPA: hypothetical protein VMT24_09575 [Aggregatilineaceae bacterium]|nr:hypothetical protein [Aggregatilineaceae bacterium]